jgi:hypothetical protein
MWAQDLQGYERLRRMLWLRHVVRRAQRHFDVAVWQAGLILRRLAFFDAGDVRLSTAAASVGLLQGLEPAPVAALHLA